MMRNFRHARGSRVSTANRADRRVSGTPLARVGSIARRGGTCLGLVLAMLSAGPLGTSAEAQGVSRTPPAQAGPGRVGHKGGALYYSDDRISIYSGARYATCRPHRSGLTYMGQAIFAASFNVPDDYVISVADVNRTYEIVSGLMAKACPEFVPTGPPDSVADVRIEFYFDDFFVGMDGVSTNEASIPSFGIGSGQDSPIAWANRNFSYHAGGYGRTYDFYYVTGNDTVTNVQRSRGYRVGRAVTPIEGEQQYKNYLKEVGSKAGIRRFWARGGFFEAK